MLNNLVINNPFRVLGVYTNAKVSEILRNERRIKACLNVGKPIQFESDSISLNETVEGEPLMDWSKHYVRVEVVPFSRINESGEYIGETFYRLAGYDSQGDRTLVDISIDELDGKSINEAHSFIENHSRNLYVDRLPGFPPFLYKTGVNRSLDSIQKAMATLSLSSDKVVSGLFWFCNASPTDTEAIEKLIQGDTELARSILHQEVESFSSILNLAILALINENLEESVFYYSKLIHDEQFRRQYLSAVTDELFNISENELASKLIDSLFQQVAPWDYNSFGNSFINEDDKQYAKNRVCSYYISAIKAEIEKARTSKSEDSYKAGKELIQHTSLDLSSLQALLTSDNLQYQTITDSLANQIQKCSIAYFNSSDEPGAIDKALELQEYAVSIATGKLTKERCKENVNLLLKQKKQSEYSYYSKYISHLVSSYSTTNTSIRRTREFLNKSIPELNSIKKITGENDSDYIAISSMVVNHAINMLVDVVNAVQDNFAYLSSLNMDDYSSDLPEDIRLSIHEPRSVRQYKTIKLALSVMDTIAGLDKNENEKKHFESNESTLKQLLLHYSMDPLLPAFVDDIPATKPDPRLRQRNRGCLINILIGFALIGGGLTSLYKIFM